MANTPNPDANKSNEQLYTERNKRITEAAALKIPDRVPSFMIQELFPAKYAGITYQDAFYDQDKWLAACEKTIIDFAPDMYFKLPGGISTAGKAWERVGYLQQKWPGYSFGPNITFQFVEGEYMKAEEYDHFLDDPTDFMIRVYLPRTNTALAGLGMLPPLKSLIMGAANLTPLLLAPPIAEAMAALQDAAPIVAKWSAREVEANQKIESLGFPSIYSSLTLAPFDMITDFLRGLRGIMLDMYRCPDKLKAAQDKLLPLMTGLAIGGATTADNPRIFIPLHRGADGFMSLPQFEEFYWPWLKQLMLNIIDAGLTPMPFYEGRYDHRLEYLRELPKGKVISWFDRTDLFRAKDIIGDVTCIAGGMPASLLHTSTVEQVRSATKQAIEVIGKGGGYIMTSSTSFNDAKPELVKAWIDATKEFGVY
jgi:hypothetical protein